MENGDMSLPNLMAGIIGSIVENKSLEDGLRDVGLSQEYVINQYCAPGSSESARQYMFEVMSSKFVDFSRNEGDGLYLVKKVFCNEDEYEEISRAISGDDTDKFKVVKMVGSNPLIMDYKQKYCGIEAYLTTAQSEMDALRKTAKSDPNFNFSRDLFDSDDAAILDGLINTAFYQHTRESFDTLFETMRDRL